jgi:hypothetical protein
MNEPPSRDEPETYTANPRAVCEILAEVRDQALRAFSGPFFDGDGAVDTPPIVKVGITESSTVHISAQRVDPALRAEITLYLRSDFDASAECRYHLHGHCEVARLDAEAHIQREFAVPLELAADGVLAIDVMALRTELAHSIRAFRT